MQVSPLLAEFESLGAPIDEYRGVRSALTCGEPALTSDRLQESVLLYDWSWKGRLAVSGPDARKWLNGMLSANVRDLNPGSVVPSFQLDPKGHILATLEIACLEPDSFLLGVEESQLPALLERLQRYVFISKLQLDPAPGQQSTSLALRGSGALPLLQQIGIASAPPACGLLTPVETPGGPATLVLRQPGGIDLVEIVTTPEQAPVLWSALLRAGAIPAGVATQEKDRILSGIPRFGVDIRGTELPQETGQMAALDFTKGCYVGQEIVERIRSRGSVHRQFRAFLLNAPVPPGSAILIEEKEVGVVTSLTEWDGAVAALGYIRRPHDEPGTAFRVAGTEGTVRPSNSFLGLERLR